MRTAVSGIALCASYPSQLKLPPTAAKRKRAAEMSLANVAPQPAGIKPGLALSIMMQRPKRWVCIWCAHVASRACALPSFGPTSSSIIPLRRNSTVVHETTEAAGSGKRQRTSYESITGSSKHEVLSMCARSLCLRLKGTHECTTVRGDTRASILTTQPRPPTARAGRRGVRCRFLQQRTQQKAPLSPQRSPASWS